MSIRFLCIASLLFSFSAIGAWLDGIHPVSREQLFGTIFPASLIGAATALLWVWPRRGTPWRRLGVCLAALVSWRVSYFPILVLSGHLASIGEWLLTRMPLLPIFVYPGFLLSVVALHAIAAFLATRLLSKQHLSVYAGIVPAFALACLISFSTLEDLTLLPDGRPTEGQPVPEPTRPEGNPYLGNVTAPGYGLAQRVLLLAAGLTYDTIPESPWAGTVKGVLEAEFAANPVATTRRRVQEHYQAYRSAHTYIGCRTLDDCPRGRGTNAGSP